MRLLLDTHVVLWELAGTRTVGPRAQQAILDAEELSFSVVSFAEIGVKASIGKLAVPADLHEQLLRSGLQILGSPPTTRSLSPTCRSTTATPSTG